MSLVACAACRRHVFAGEPRCPFCGAPVDSAAERADIPRLSRAAQLAWKITLGGAAVSACASAQGPQKTAEVIPQPVDASTVADAGGLDADAEVDERRPTNTVPIYGASAILILQYVSFDRGAEAFGKQHEALLDEVAVVLKARADLLVVVEGHASTDEPGGAKLSEARARRVAAALVKRGVPKDRLRWIGRGSTQPIEPNNLAKNRRVHFRVTESDEFAKTGVPVE